MTCGFRLKILLSAKNQLEKCSLYKKVTFLKLLLKEFYQKYQLFKVIFGQGCHMHENVTNYLKTVRILTLGVEKFRTDFFFFKYFLQFL